MSTFDTTQTQVQPWHYDASQYNADEDASQRDCCCGKLRGNFVHPYTPSDHVLWADSEAAARDVFATTAFAHRYVDKRTDGEYCIFSYRDLIGCVMIAASLMGMGQYALGFAPPNGFWLPVSMVIGVVQAILFVQILYLHFVAPPTHSNAQTRRILHYIVAVVIGFSHVAESILNYQYCEEAYDMMDMFGLGNRTLRSTQSTCVNIIDAYFTTGIFIVFFTLFVSAQFTAAMSLLHVIIHGLSRLQPRVKHEAAGELTAKFLIYVFIDTIAVVLTHMREVGHTAAFEQMLRGKIEAQRAEIAANQVDALLCAMVPHTVLPRLMSGDSHIVDSAASATILFSDIKGFTAWSSRRTPEQVVHMISVLAFEFDSIADVSPGIEKVKTIGDAYWAICGLPESCEDHASRMVDFGQAILLRLDVINACHESEWGKVMMRVGVHSGPVRCALLGTLQRSYEPFGTTSDDANLIEQVGVPGHVCISGVTKGLIESENRSDIPVGLLAYTHVLSTQDDKTTGELPVFRVERPALRLSPENDTKNEQQHGQGECYQQPHHDENAPTETGAPHSSSQSGSRAWENDSRSRRQSTVLTSNPAINSPLTQDVAENAAKDERKKFLAAQVAKRRREEATKRKRKSGGQQAGGQSPKAQGELPDGEELLLSEDQALADLEALFARRHTWIFQDFANVEVEASYRNFAAERQAQARKAAQIGLVVFLVVILVGIPIAGSGAMSPISIILLLIALVNAVSLAVFAVTGKSNDKWAFTQMLGSLVVGTLAVIGASQIGEDVTVGNDLLYIWVIIVGSASYTSAGMSALVFSLLQHIIVATPTLLFSFSSRMFAVNATFIFLCLPIFYAVIFLTERNLRLQFKSSFFEAHHMHVRRVQSTVRQVLLESMVPRHVVAPLQRWMGEEAMDPERTIQRFHPNVAIAFIRIHHPRQDVRRFNADADRLDENNNSNNNDNQVWIIEAHQDLDHILAYVDNVKALNMSQQQQSPVHGFVGIGGTPLATSTPTSLATPTIHLGGASRETSSSESSHKMTQRPNPLTGEPRKTASDDSDAVEVESVATTRLTATTGSSSSSSNLAPPRFPKRSSPHVIPPSPSGGQTPSGLTSSLNVSSSSLRRVASSFPAIVKVKTIGSTVMLAGSFEPEKWTPEQAAEQMIQAVTAIAQGLDHQGLSISAGIHVGPVVGCVLGLNRLAFDVFGDAVNVASRVLSCSTKLEQETDERKKISVSSRLPSSTVVHVSQGFLDTLCRAAGVTTTGSFAAEPVELEAKGKGTIAAWRMTDPVMSENVWDDEIDQFWLGA